MCGIENIEKVFKVFLYKSPLTIIQIDDHKGGK